MIRAILFDVDGTLVDSNDLHATAWQQTFSHFGVELPFDRVRSQIGKGGDNLIPALLPAKLVERCRDSIEQHRSDLYRHHFLPRVISFPGVRPLFARLFEDGIQIVLATSSRQAELDYLAGLTGAADLVHAKVSKDGVERSKPCPDIFAAALAKAGMAGPDQALVVGDSPWDMKAAGRIGLAAIGLRCGGFSDRELLAGGAVALFDSPEALLEAYPSWLSP